VQLAVDLHNTRPSRLITTPNQQAPPPLHDHYQTKTPCHLHTCRATLIDTIAILQLIAKNKQTTEPETHHNAKPTNGPAFFRVHYHTKTPCHLHAYHAKLIDGIEILQLIASKKQTTEIKRDHGGICASTTGAVRPR